jgi:MFS family permease
VVGGATKGAKPVDPVRDEALTSSAPDPPTRAYPLFLVGLGSWYGAWGMQTVLFQWLIVDQLGVSASRVGTAQMAVMLPSLLFLLVGGAAADRIDRRRTLVLLHGLAALACAGLGLCVAFGALSFELLVGYGLVAGTLQAFVIPTRDAQLSDVVRTGMSRAVAGLTSVQHGGQGLGAVCAGLASLVGAPPVLALQSVVALVGALSTTRLPRASPDARAHVPPLHLRELRAGVVEVARSPVLRSVMLLNVSVGLTFVGAYLVLLPLMVRELYGGGAEKMGLLVAALPIGSIAVNLVIVARGGIVRQGRSLLLGQGFAGLCLGALAFGPSLFGAALATLMWGVGAAFAINASRTLFQEHASEANRGRVLSVYSLAILGTAPIGALVTGLLAGWVGTLATLALQSAVMTVLIVATLLFTGVRRLR